MDRTSNKEIKKYILIWLLVVAAVTLELVCFSAYYEVDERKKITELIQDYPELEPEIIDIMQNVQETPIFENNSNIPIIEEKYGYDFEKSVFSRELLLCVAVAGAGCGIIIFFFARSGQKQRVQDEKLFDLIKEELLNIQKGNYHLLFCRSTDIEHMDMPDKWETVFGTLKELGYYLEELKEQLCEEENSTKSLITDISHQLKTPLASLRMCHELTMSEKLTSEEKREFQEQEKREIDKLELLLNELVKLSRLESHMVQIQLEQQEIQRTISEAVSLVYGKAKGKEIDIQVDMQSNATILHDMKWTAEALANVLDNAIKYSENRTAIQIKVSSLPTNILIEIEDQGMGIPTADLHNIFKRFYRGREASQKVKDGVGVGLYLSRYIIELQGGTIFAKRKQDKGTVFQITLPL